MKSLLAKDPIDYSKKERKMYPLTVRKYVLKLQAM